VLLRSSRARNTVIRRGRPISPPNRRRMSTCRVTRFPGDYDVLAVERPCAVAGPLKCPCVVGRGSAAELGHHPPPTKAGDIPSRS
jgi:hypothetical protein